jgi:hypothetical protein
MNGHILGEYGDEEALSGSEKEYVSKLRFIQELGPARTIYVSHGAGEDWFVVEPQVGYLHSVTGAPLTTQAAVSRLVEANRTVYELRPKLWRNRRVARGTERLEPSWRPVLYLAAGLVLGALIRSIT